VRQLVLLRSCQLWDRLEPNFGIILKDIGFAGRGTPFQTMWNIAMGNVIVSGVVTFKSSLLPRPPSSSPFGRASTTSPALEG
jgi:hypothetical protein